MPLKLITALLQCRNPPAVTRRWLCALAGVSYESRTTSNALGKLCTLGLIDDLANGQLMASHTAHERYDGKVKPLPRGAALLDYWRNRIGGGVPRKLFETVIAARGAISRRDLCQRAGVSYVSRTTSNALGGSAILKVRGTGDA